VTDSEPGILVHCTEQAVYIRVHGRGTFQNGQPLRRFAAEMIMRGHRQFVLDLEPCAGMDSTFLGVLTGIGLSLRQPQPPGTVHIIHASPHSRDLLKSLWLDRLFSVIDTGAALPGFVPPAGGELRKLPDSDPRGGAKPMPREETRELLLTAHDDLVRADNRNAPKFAAVTRLLREEAPPPRT
jgi:anti-sigma B factor antagonist